VFFDFAESGRLLKRLNLFSKKDWRDSNCGAHGAKRSPLRARSGCEPVPRQKIFDEKVFSRGRNFRPLRKIKKQAGMNLYYRVQIYNFCEENKEYDKIYFIMEYRNFEDIRENELQVREQQQSLLESLSGFSRLSNKQKSFILDSLYIQQRAERGTDIVSASRIYKSVSDIDINKLAPGGTYITHGGEDSEILKQQPEKNKNRYKKSQVYIMNKNCHRVIAEIEKLAEEKNLSRGWSYAGPINSYEDLVELAVLVDKTNKPPYVIEIWHSEPKEDEPLEHAHTTLILGQNNDGEYVVWEKAGFSLPFQLTTLKQVYDAYHKYSGWRIRQLSV